MFQRFASVILAGVVILSATSCKKAPKDLTAEREAKFRAEQKARALKSYQDLVKKYPDSEYAAKAKERIRALTPPTTPKK